MCFDYNLYLKKKWKIKQNKILENKQQKCEHGKSHLSLTETEMLNVFRLYFVDHIIFVWAEIAAHKYNMCLRRLKIVHLAFDQHIRNIDPLVFNASLSCLWLFSYGGRVFYGLSLFIHKTLHNKSQTALRDCFTQFFWKLTIYFLMIFKLFCWWILNYIVYFI